MICEPADLTPIRQALEAQGVEVASAGLAVEPSTMVEVSGQDAPALLRMLDAIEDQDDVNEVHSNFDIPDEVLRELADRD